VFYSWFRLYGSTLHHSHTIRIRWSALDAGLLLIPSSITTGIMMPFIGKMIQRAPQAYLVAAFF
jgi:DHA2 family multidrug resistance protein